MFVVVYIFRVAKQNVPDFLRVQEEAGEIYLQYGALADETLIPFSLEAKYGCDSLLNVVEVGNDEQLHIGVSRFKSKEHHDEVMAKVDTDERINPLYKEMLAIINMAHATRGEFEIAS